MDRTLKLREAMARVVASLRAVIDDLGLTNDEWMAVLSSLNNVGRPEEFVLLSDVMQLSAYVDQRAHAYSAAMPSNVEGPFWFERGSHWSRPVGLDAISTPPRLCSCRAGG